MSGALIYQKENLFNCTKTFVLEDCQQFQLINARTEWADVRDCAFERNIRTLPSEMISVHPRLLKRTFQHFIFQIYLPELLVFFLSLIINMADKATT